MNKKAQVTMDKIVPVILTLVIAGLVIGAGSLVLSKFGDKLQTTTTSAVLAEKGNGSTHAFLNASGYFIVARNNTNFLSFVIDALYNTTSADDNTLLEVGNYSIVTTTGQILNASLLNYGNISVNYTYTLNVNPSEVQVTRNASQAVLELASFFPTIGIIIAMMVILGLIIMRKSGLGQFR